eukprot:scaffold2195_cov333-Pavlova_lutheri.AAC.2
MSCAHRVVPRLDPRGSGSISGSPFQAIPFELGWEGTTFGFRPSYPQSDPVEAEGGRAPPSTSFGSDFDGGVHGSRSRGKVSMGRADGRSLGTWREIEGTRPSPTMAEKSTVEREDGYRKPPWKFTGR